MWHLLVALVEGADDDDDDAAADENVSLRGSQKALTLLLTQSSSIWVGLSLHICLKLNTALLLISRQLVPWHAPSHPLCITWSWLIVATLGGFKLCRGKDQHANSITVRQRRLNTANLQWISSTAWSECRLNSGPTCWDCLRDTRE